MQADGGVIEQAGVVDYGTGPVAPGVFVLVRTDDPYANHETSYGLSSRAWAATPASR